MITTKQPASGFTILELLVATTVFSVVLLGALTGFLEMGKIFYKGVNTTSTQSVANQILQDVSGQFQSAAAFTKVLPQGNVGSEVTPATDQSSHGVNSYAYYCIGNTRYTYVIASNDSSMVNFSNTPNWLPGGNFGILRDTLAGSSSCATPCWSGHNCTGSTSAVPFNNPVELLGDNMRLNAFYIDQSGSSNLFNVTITVAYGSDDVFNDHSAVPLVCNGTSGADQYCSVATLQTAVLKGLN